jgi:hypothetical protein
MKQNPDFFTPCPAELDPRFRTKKQQPEESMCEETAFMGIKKPTENWTKFPNCILDNLEYFTPAEVKIIALMVRKNLGFQNPNYKFANAYIQAKTNMVKNTIKAALDSLIAKQIIVLIPGRNTNQAPLYAINWINGDDIEIDPALAPRKKAPVKKWEKSVGGSKNDPQGGSKNDPSIIKQLKETIGSNGKSPVTSDFKESLKLKKKGGSPVKTKKLHPDTLHLIEHWNTLAEQVPKIIRPSMHGTGARTKTILRIDAIVSALASGEFATRFPLEAKRCMTASRFPVPKAMLEKKWTLDDMKKALVIYFLSYQEGYWPHGTEKKKELPKTLSIVLLSAHAQARPSWFLTSAAHPPKAAEACQYPEALEMVTRVFTKYAHTPTHNDNVSLISVANALGREYKTIDSSILPYTCMRYYERAGTFKRFLSLFEDFLEYLFQNDRESLQMQPGMLRPGSKTWETFLRYVDAEFGVQLTLWDTKPEDWAKAKFSLIFMHTRDMINKSSIESFRRRCGDRMIVMTYDEQEKIVAEWKQQNEHKGSPYKHEWGRKIYRDLMAGKLK